MYECLSLKSVVCCQVVSASDRSLVQRMPTECGVSECDREDSIMRWPWPTRGSAVRKKKFNLGSRALKPKMYSVNDV